jgi:hypothetical protein
MKKWSLMQSDLQQKPYKWDETLITTSTNIWAIHLVVCRLLPPNHLPPTEKLHWFIISRWDVVCFWIHWLVQNTKLHPFLIHAGSVYTVCCLRSFSFSFPNCLCNRSWIRSCAISISLNLITSPERASQSLFLLFLSFFSTALAEQ